MTVVHVIIVRIAVNIILQDLSRWKVRLNPQPSNHSCSLVVIEGILRANLYLMASLVTGQIVACELFTPMAKAAERAIHSNGYSQAIKVLPKRSDEIMIGKSLNIFLETSIFPKVSVIF